MQLKGKVDDGGHNTCQAHYHTGSVKKTVFQAVILLFTDKKGYNPSIQFRFVLHDSGDLEITELFTSIQNIFEIINMEHVSTFSNFVIY